MGELNETTAAIKRRKLLISFLKHPSKIKDLIRGNHHSHRMGKKGTRTPSVVPKKKNLSRCKSSHQEVKDMGNRQKRVKE